MSERNNNDLFEKQPWTLRTKTRKDPPKKPSESQKQQARVKRRIEEILEERELNKLWSIEDDIT
ncbi:hypothetical protein [Vibrio maritimus]|uniref:hypothetical protein n=1 Tax=Vibrio maritimus TaxID=990268 RepID=UPI001F40271B|nr:hypothetical protein [Vibrio maritimus]